MLGGFGLLACAPRLRTSCQLGAPRPPRCGALVMWSMSGNACTGLRCDRRAIQARHHLLDHGDSMVVVLARERPSAVELVECLRPLAKRGEDSAVYEDCLHAARGAESLGRV